MSLGIINEAVAQETMGLKPFPVQYWPGQGIWMYITSLKDENIV